MTFGDTCKKKGENFCGDLHASCLMQELKKQDKEAEFRFYGGEEMKAGGGTISNRKKIGSDKRILFRSSLPIF